jgi:Predicted amidohydrolase
LIRSFALQGVDALIFIAQWPKARKAHWETLLPARAIENQTLVLGVNAVGSAFGTPLAAQQGLSLMTEAPSLSLKRI